STLRHPASHAVLTCLQMLPVATHKSSSLTLEARSASQCRPTRVCLQKASGHAWYRCLRGKFSRNRRKSTATACYPQASRPGSLWSRPLLSVGKDTLVHPVGLSACTLSEHRRRSKNCNGSLGSSRLM